jgi:uncharacterized SAM-binding protein YcdF (DUF218 family)
MEKSYEAITDFVFIEDKPEKAEKADIILVPGGSSPELMEKACELFIAGYAPLILPSGGPNKKVTDYETEWDYFFDIAKKKGISEANILKENRATNTFENAIYSKEVVKENKIEIRRALLVCKTFHARRALLTYQAAFNPLIEYIICPIIDNRDIRKDNWYLDQNKVNKVMSEVEKIGKYFAAYIMKIK